jgi:hypothetical protein
VTREHTNSTLSGRSEYAQQAHEHVPVVATIDGKVCSLVTLSWRFQVRRML